MSQQNNKDMAKYFYRASAKDFRRIPGNPIAYSLTDNERRLFDKKPVSTLGEQRLGIQTGDNDRFLRRFHEVNISSFSSSIEDPISWPEKINWVPINKGGDYRKWFGNKEFVILWGNNGEAIKKHKLEMLRLGYIEKKNSGCWNEEYYFISCISWNRISSIRFGCRFEPKGAIFETASPSMFFEETEDLFFVMGLYNSKITQRLASILSPTLTFQSGDLQKIPLAENGKFVDTKLIQILIDISRIDWNAYETSWDFSRLPFLRLDYRQSMLKASYQNLRAHWLETTQEMLRLEEKNNRLFIDAYGLQDELTPEVPLSEITLTCNPHYRYGGNLTEQEREVRLQSDTIAELISYSIGCMMGRYSLDREGLVYAHSSNVGFSELVAEGAYQTFPADGDGILPLTSEHWFDDDVAARVEEFVGTVWGEEHLEENLQFIADSLCLSAIKPVKKSGETARETIRRYLSTQFFKDHLKTYKKRPIYWLFSSGKEKAFECLVYLHRYNEATLPRMRTEYVSPLLGQMANRIELLRLKKVDAATAEAKRLDKEIDSLTKQLTELRAFDDQLKHYADMKITLDLDDGVKVNYGKFGNLLAEVKAITGDKGE